MPAIPSVVCCTVAAIPARVGEQVLSTAFSVAAPEAPAPRPPAPPVYRVHPVAESPPAPPARLHLVNGCFLI
jgi:hypothetical protein